ncbi:hypothetical protein [Streptomyces sp. NPDC006645]|uniref:effector-associated constant component EACC1 n=1 Tax=unclassified Streptomyces TaxID=2593676 RepID=UPI0033A24E89
MRLMIQLADGPDTEGSVRSLHDWLLMDRNVRQNATVGLTSSRPPVPGAQGTVIDVVSLVVQAGLSAGSLGIAIAAWRAARPQAPSVTVESPDGRRITISGASADEAREMLRPLLGEEEADE